MRVICWWAATGSSQDGYYDDQGRWIQGYYDEAGGYVQGETDAPLASLAGDSSLIHSFI